MENPAFAPFKKPLSIAIMNIGGLQEFNIYSCFIKKTLQKGALY